MNLVKSVSHFSLFCLLFATIIMVNKDFQKSCHFRRLSHRVSQTVQDRTKVATDHYALSTGVEINDLG